MSILSAFSLTYGKIDNKENHVPCQIIIKLDSAKLLEAEADLLERISEEVKTAIQELQNII